MQVSITVEGRDVLAVEDEWRRAQSARMDLDRELGFAPGSRRPEITARRERELRRSLERAIAEERRLEELVDVACGASEALRWERDAAWDLVGDRELGLLSEDQDREQRAWKNLKAARTHLVGLGATVKADGPDEGWPATITEWLVEVDGRVYEIVPDERDGVALEAKTWVGIDKVPRRVRDTAEEQSERESDELPF